MRVWTVLLSLALALLVATNVPAQEKKPPAQKHPVAERFAKMDTNHDGILTETEFVAARAKMGEAKAKKVYEEMCKLGGTTTKDKATGMTFDQFKRPLRSGGRAIPESPPRQIAGRRTRFSREPPAGTGGSSLIDGGAAGGDAERKGAVPRRSPLYASPRCSVFLGIVRSTAFRRRSPQMHRAA